MRVALVAFVLVSGVIVILGLSDALSPLGVTNLTGGSGALLLCIPVSLALFSLYVNILTSPLEQGWNRNKPAQYTQPGERLRSSLHINKVSGTSLKNKKSKYSEIHLLPNPRNRRL